MVNRLSVPLMLVVLAAGAGAAFAQGAFPAPLPGGYATDPSAPKANLGGSSPLSPGGIAACVSSACSRGFAPLREDAEKKGKLIKEAANRRAPPDEACKLIKSYGAAEVKLIDYVETNTPRCGIPAQVADQLRAGHENTEALQNRVCVIAEQWRTRGSEPSMSEVLGMSQAPASPRGPVGDFEMFR
jgi:hypothetical protein